MRGVLRGDDARWIAVIWRAIIRGRFEARLTVVRNAFPRGDDEDFNVRTPRDGPRGLPKDFDVGAPADGPRGRLPGRVVWSAAANGATQEEGRAPRNGARAPQGARPCGVFHLDGTRHGVHAVGLDGDVNEKKKTK